jgi:tryptophanyl-tRNA synthetase
MILKVENSKYLDRKYKELLNTNNKSKMSESIVTPWEVKGKIEYMRLVEKFGTELIDQPLIEKFERITKKPIHPWIRRHIFFSHRALDVFLTAYENGEPVFLYTGRGPTSDSMHIGHLIPFLFTKWLQDVFDCPLVIQMSDDEKYYFKPLDFKTIYKLGFENAKDIIACGFNPKKTFIFSNRDHRLHPEGRGFEEFVSEMKKMVNVNYVQKIFGFNEESNVGQLDWPFYQSAAAFSKAFPHIFGEKQAHCLVAYAIDQDPYFRMARDMAQKMGLIKPYSIMCQFIPPLTGPEGKMSSSIGAEATLFLTDSPEVVKSKIMKYAFSGGGGDGTLEQHKKFGGNVEVDIACQYLKYFENDDNKLEDVYSGFKKGELSCAYMKELLSIKLAELIMRHQEQRALITKEVIEDFYSYKKMILNNVSVEKGRCNQELVKYMDEHKICYDVVPHNPITSGELEIELNMKLNDRLWKAMLLCDHDNNYYMFLTK